MSPTESPTRPAPLLARVRVWHLGLLVAFVAFAIAEIQGQRRTEPFLIALAGAGFAAYWVLGWLGWHLARRFEARLGRVEVLVGYLAAMGALFLVATIAYLVLERLYLGF